MTQDKLPSGLTTACPCHVGSQPRVEGLCAVLYRMRPVTPTPQLVLLGVLCRRSKLALRGRFPYHQGAGLGRDAIWTMQHQVTWRCESAIKAAGCYLHSLVTLNHCSVGYFWPLPDHISPYSHHEILHALGNHICGRCVQVFGSSLLGNCPPKGLYHTSAHRQQPWEGCSGLGIISQCVLSAQTRTCLQALVTFPSS